MKTLQEKRENFRKWVAENKDHYRAYQKKWREDNKGLRSAYRREYYLATIDGSRFKRDKEALQKAFLTILETIVPDIILKEQIKAVRTRIAELTTVNSDTWVFKPDSEIMLIPEPELKGYVIQNNNQLTEIKVA